MGTREFTRRRFLAGGAAAGGFALLAACGGGATGGAMAEEEMAEPEQAQEATQPEAEQVTVVFRDWREPGRTATTWDTWFNWSNDAFVEMHPEVAAVEYSFIGWGDQYIQKLVTEAAARVSADVVHSSIIWGRDLWDNGLLLDLSSHVATAPDVGLDQFMPSAEPYSTAEGKTFGISFWGPDSYVMVINQDHYVEAGLDPQGADQDTWEGLAAVTEKLSKKDAAGNYERLGFTYHIPGMAEFSAWTYVNGGAMHNADLTEAIFDTAEALQVAEHRALQYVKYKDRVEGYPGGLESLQNGLGSGISWGTWAAYYVRDEFPEDFNFWMVPIPKGPSSADDTTGTTWINMMVVPDGSSQPDFAFEYSRFICGLEAQIKKLELVKQVSPRLDFYNSTEWSAAVEELPQLAVVPEVGAGGKPYPFFRRYTAANQQFPIVGDAMRGESDLDLRGALAEAVRLITEELQAQ